MVGGARWRKKPTQIKIKTSVLNKLDSGLLAKSVHFIINQHHAVTSGLYQLKDVGDMPVSPETHHSYIPRWQE